VVHADETGIDKGGGRFWLHCVSNLFWTLYYPHEKRGLTRNPDGWFHRGFAVFAVSTPAYTAQHFYSNSPFPRVPPGIRVQPWGLASYPENVPSEFSHSPVYMPSWLTT
jgi:hypothetical protein